MSAPRRRRDPAPVVRGGDLAVLVFGGGLILAGLAALVGLGAAAALFGGGWVWPHGIHTATATLGGLLGGHPGRGLPTGPRARVPGTGVVCTGVVFAELLMLTLLGAGTAMWSRYRRPGDARGGMATFWEARQALGVSRLRQARGIIRPDLYPGGPR